MDYAEILYERVGDVASIRLNQPQSLNAFTTRMGQEVLHALRRAEQEARAILIGGVGRGFCSGANLGEEGFDFTDPQRDAGRRLDGIFHPILREMRGSPIPIVTAVRGSVVGIGCGIALAADLIVAGESAFFLQAFCNVGLAVDGGSSYFLTRAIGRPRAMEMMLLGSKLGAARALDWGLINRVVPDDQVDQAALAIAGQLARGPRSLGIIKREAWAALDAPFETALAGEREAQREAGRSADFIEGVNAFRDKRAAQFTGS